MQAAIRYRTLVRQAEQREDSTRGKRGPTAGGRPVRIAAARGAVLLRSGGRCENPDCAGQPEELTDAGHPILEVDHVEELASGGRDHPSRMIALCPNCHALKTRGRNRARLADILCRIAEDRHTRWVELVKPQARP
ncbi:HNH endonuclease signature motif containing protein [Streptomyces sp. NPDC002209]|uniref:HNH endonuclease signature motif containing protein n=1 Tax=Streptomyces sp. NPDC002209 TaxID=3364638 RepID=UPI0036C01218